MSSSMIDKLQIEYQLFSAKEKEIADYVMRNHSSIMNINIRDLAANLVIGISNSGRTIEVSDALNAAKKRGAKV